MTNASFPVEHGLSRAPVARVPGLAPLLGRTLVLLAVAASVAISLRSTGADAAAKADLDLTNLLRFMAALKAVLAIGALGAVLWRLGVPATPSRLAAYAVASAGMAAGPGLIWGMDHVALGALLLHGGLAASIVLLWLDPATAARLGSLVAARSRRR